MKILSLIFSITSIVFLSINSGAQITHDISAPAGSGDFGRIVSLLPNGHIVINDKDYSIPDGPQKVGAVYHYDSNRNLISTIVGLKANDQIGNGGIVVLANGNYLIYSRNWTGDRTEMGSALTLCNGEQGCGGNVTRANSLYMEKNAEATMWTTPLPNGNYVVRNPFWSNGTIREAGAVTLCDGVVGCSGPVSQANSFVGVNERNLIGGSRDDTYGTKTITVLKNGNFVFQSQNWGDGTTEALGAVTFCRAIGPCTGVVSRANSLVGSKKFDWVGRIEFPIGLLPNGGYVVVSPFWGDGLGGAQASGSVTFGNGETGVAGEISTSNSLIGTPGNKVGYKILVMKTGNYAVLSPSWSYEGKAAVGAITLANGRTGISGIISPANSLIGASAGDSVGDAVIELTTGDLIVNCPRCDKGNIIDAGLVTRINVKKGAVGVIDPRRSLSGTDSGDRVGIQVEEISPGKVIVYSPYWRNGEVPDLGAITLVDDASELRAVVSVENSFVGTRAGDQIGVMSGGVIRLSNGNYVVRNPYWQNGRLRRAGAVTFLSAVNGIRGSISKSNSLVGTSEDDRVGSQLQPLPNGNYLVQTPSWDNGLNKDAGAVSFCRGDRGCMGAIDQSNSLIGQNANEFIGSVVSVMANSNYLISSQGWNREAGAVTFGGPDGIVGSITPENSLVGGSDIDRIRIVEKMGENTFFLGNTNWRNGASARAGAIMFYDGTKPLTGKVSAENSLVGSKIGDQVGQNIIKLTDEKFAILSPSWNSEVENFAGAVTLYNRGDSLSGYVNYSNSIIGSAQAAGVGNSPILDRQRSRLILPRGIERKVTILEY